MASEKVASEKGQASRDMMNGVKFSYLSFGKFSFSRFLGFLMERNEKEIVSLKKLKARSCIK